MAKDSDAVRGPQGKPLPANEYVAPERIWMVESHWAGGLWAMTQPFELLESHRDALELAADYAKDDLADGLDGGPYRVAEFVRAELAGPPAWLVDWARWLLECAADEASGSGYRQARRMYAEALRRIDREQIFRERALALLATPPAAAVCVGGAP